MSILPKNTDDPGPPKFLLWGRPNVGKTIAACSASAHFDPEKLGKEVQVLKDVFLIGAENGVTSLKNLKLSVPNWFDLTEHMLTKDGAPSLPKFEKAQEEVFSYVHKEASADSIVIYDSLSAADLFANGFYSITKNDGKYGVLNAMATFHLQLSLRLANLPGLPVVTAHGKATAPIDNDDTKKYKDAKASVSGLSEKHMYTTLALTGNQAAHYFRNFNEIYAMEAKSVRRKGVSSVERTFNTQSTDTMEAKTKYDNVLQAQEPANLRAILKKIGAVK